MYAEWAVVVGAMVGGATSLVGNALVRRWQTQDIQNAAKAAVFQGGILLPDNIYNCINIFHEFELFNSNTAQASTVARSVSLLGNTLPNLPVNIPKNYFKSFCALAKANNSVCKMQTYFKTESLIDWKEDTECKEQLVFKGFFESLIASHIEAITVIRDQKEFREMQYFYPDDIAESIRNAMSIKNLNSPRIDKLLEECFQ